MSENLFVYGTLKDPNVQNRVFGRVTSGQADVLIGYEKSQTEINGTIYPALVPKPDNEIGGLILEVSPKELEKIDEYETDAYKRVLVKLKSDTEAWVYLKAE